MIRIFIVLAFSFVLSACGADTILGSNKAPDELAVIEGPALSLPPDYDLRPPLDEVDMSKRRTETAKRVVFGETEEEAKMKAANKSEDSWLLEQAGADEFDPKIRQKLTVAEKVEEKERKKSWLSRKKEELFGGDDEAQPAE